MNLTPLKYLLFLENVTCVFRNYLLLKKCSRVLVFIFICTEMLNNIVSLVIGLQKENQIEIKAQGIYFYSVTGFSIYIIISSVYFSKTFHKLLSNFDAFYNIFDDEVYSNTMSKAQRGLTFMVVLFCSTKITVLTVVRIFRGDHGMGIIGTTMFCYNITICDFRYIFQYFILHSILFVISEQLKAITRSIASDIASTRAYRRYEQDAEGWTSVAVEQDHLKKLDKWMKAYQNINDSSNLFKMMFSAQLTIMLLIVTAYYIILLYSIAISTVEGVQTMLSVLMNMFSMVVFLMALFLVSRAGQRVQNSALQLRQKLCELCVYSLENEEYYKLAKDLLRCVRTRPVRIHVFGSLDVNMAMLPSIVAFFTSYTVIALQFNNIL